MFNPEFMKYMLYVLRRFWIVVLVAALLGGGAYLFLDRQDPAYRAEARIFIGNALDPNPDRTELQTALLLVPTYAEFARNANVLQATIDNLDLDVSLTTLRRWVSTRVITDTPILAIRATTTDPELSAEIANEVARNIIALSPSNLTDEELAQMELLEVQLRELEELNITTREQSANALEQLNRAQDSNADIETLAELRARYAEQVDRLNQTRSILAATSDTYLSLANRVGRLEIVEEATPPRGASGLSPVLVGAIAAVAGAGAAAAALLLFLEYFDHRVRTENEVVRRLKLPVIGKTRRSREVAANQKSYLANSDKLNTMPLAESYRKVQANLLFGQSANGQSTRVYMVASPQRDDGRTFTAANIAATMAASGQHVLLVDADLRDPQIHELFNLKNNQGLTTILSSGCQSLEEYAALLKDVIQETNITNLHVLASGTGGTPVNAYILGFEQFSAAVEALLTEFEYDVILLDTPPSTEVADSYVMAATTEAKVLLVTSYAKTTGPDVALLRDQFQHVGASISGVVLNKI